LLETASELDAITIVDAAIENAKKTAESFTLDFTVYTNGSRTEEGAVGYAVVQKKGHT